MKIIKAILALAAAIVILGLGLVLTRFPGMSPARTIDPNDAMMHVQSAFAGPFGLSLSGATLVEGCKDKGRDGAYRFLLRTDEGFDYQALTVQLRSGEVLARLNTDSSLPRWTMQVAGAVGDADVMRECGKAANLKSATIFEYTQSFPARNHWRRIILSVPDRRIYLELGHT